MSEEQASDRIHFEFFYEYGKDYGYFHHGWLPHAEFEELVRGDTPPLVRINDVSYWSSEEGKFLGQRPGGSQAAGAAYFHRDRMSRIWPVDPIPAAEVRPGDDDRRPPPKLRRKLEEFFGGPIEAPRIIQQVLAESDLPNLELAVADLLRREASTHQLLGVMANEQFEYHPGLRMVLARLSEGHAEYYAVRVGPPEWKRLAVEADRYRDCLSMGLYLVDSRRGKLVLAIWPARQGASTLEVMALDEDVARDIIDDLRAGMTRLSIYRGKVIELRPQSDGCGYEVGFASLKVPARADIVLPEGLLDLIERNALAVLRHRDRLLDAERHLRRGLLFHGKPGTGKTLTARYLVGQLRDYTVMLLTGPSLGLLPHACRLARALSPSAVIIEDVDLIARERSRNDYASLLHNLLDEMDGLSPKIEMVFIMTTNRPELLEPALASRPGRIDQAVEFPLPDQAARRRIFELYARGMPVNADLQAFVDRTEGASGAFIEELLRRALVFASEEGTPEVLDRHLESALKELVLAGGDLTRSLLGYA